MLNPRGRLRPTRTIHIREKSPYAATTAVSTAATRRTRRSASGADTMVGGTITVRGEPDAAAQYGGSGTVWTLECPMVLRRSALPRPRRAGIFIAFDGLDRTEQTSDLGYLPQRTISRPLDHRPACDPLRRGRRRRRPRRAPLLRA